MDSMPQSKGIEYQTWLKTKTRSCVAYNRLITLRIKGWKKLFQANGSHNQAGVAMLISDKVDFRLKSIRRNNEGHFTLRKE
jgi:hypothetical protein